MISNTQRWEIAFFSTLGLAIGTAFCMKLMERGIKAGGEPFSILDLELFYSRAEVSSVLGQLDNNVTTILRYHLAFDFAFMAGIFPCIVALCMIAAERQITKVWRKSLVFLAILQLLAWAFDVVENLFLFQWIGNRAVGDHFGLFRLLVASKWVIAITGSMAALLVLLLNKKRR